MPVLFIEGPPGIRPEKKRAMMQKISEAIDEAYHIGASIPLKTWPWTAAFSPRTLKS